MAEKFKLDLGGILTEEEAKAMFDGSVLQDEPSADNGQEIDNDDNPAEERDESQASERVGEDEGTSSEDAAETNDGGSSQNLYSSIASALRNDGIFPDLTDDDIANVTTPDAFAELFEKTVDARLDERQKRMYAALNDGVDPGSVRAYEETLQYLGSITPDAVKEEGERGENLRRQLIFNDLVSRGYSNEKANREVEKSFRSGSDVDDAQDALEALRTHYSNQYDQVRQQAAQKAEAVKQQQKRQAADFKKMLLDDEVKFGDTVLDKRTCQKVFDAVSKPVYKDANTGALLTEVQKFQADHPLEFLKQVGMWFVLTDGGKNASGIVKKQAQVEKNKNIRELERKINSSSLDRDGSLKYVSNGGSDEMSSLLLSDDWKVGFGK